MLTSININTSVNEKAVKYASLSVTYAYLNQH